MASSFTTPADLRMLGNYQWEILTEFDFHVGCHPSDVVVKVPVGFVTDLASVPRPFWAIMPPDGKYAKAAIVHDYLYSKDGGINGKNFADFCFLEGMEVLGVPRWQRVILYSAVRLFGAKRFKGITTR